ncbi:MAG: TIGR00730 family Rossman fold protein [Jatrophihabitans sp.]
MAAICVYCASVPQIESRFLDLATEIGTLIAARGHTLVSGGGSVSMMGAVAAAARAGGARTVGVMPQALVNAEIADESSDELVVVDTMRERKRVMEERSDAFVVLPGGIGTLEELFEMWTARYLMMHTKPVVLLNAFGFYDPLLQMIDTMYRAGFVRPVSLEVLHRATTAAEAVDAVDAALAG